MKEDDLNDEGYLLARDHSAADSEYKRRGSAAFKRSPEYEKPDNGLTPEEHIARKISEETNPDKIVMFQKLKDVVESGDTEQQNN